jgi:hypothetical protein
VIDAAEPLYGLRHNPRGGALHPPLTETTMPDASPSHEHIGETARVANHDHDMIHELSKRLDALWRYDQYIENASDHPKLGKFFERVKEQEKANIDELKELLAEHIRKDCF